MILALGAYYLFGFLQPATSPQTPANTAAVQSAPSATLANSPTPADPKELLDLGRKVNGLVGPDVQPWHLKATFEVFDEDGRSKDKGTFEEWWVSDKQYKRSYQSAAFSQTQYGTDHGVLVTGNSDQPRGLIAVVRQKLANPLPNEAWMNNSEPKLSDRDFGGVKLHCVYMNSKLPPKQNAPPLVYPSFCFGPQKPMLRYESDMNHFDDTLFNKLVIFRGRYIAGDIVTTHLGKTVLTVHLESLAPFDQADLAGLQPPPDAVALAKRVDVSPGVMAGNIIRKVNPEYPQGARALRVEGVVTIQATIGKDGHVQGDLRAISGPEQLQAAAVDAVRQWVYTPYLLNGEPVQVGTLINVVFSLGGRPN
jgi:TonB family protein